MEINLEELTRFLVQAKSRTYAGKGKNVLSQRPDFKELLYREGEYEYRDSYTGFYRAPGQEIVRFRGKPIWNMAYNGGMIQEYHGQREFTQQTFSFLRKALLRVEERRPFRGPELFLEGKFEYRDSSEGDLESFSGVERIYYNDNEAFPSESKEVFRQRYIGGIIISK